MTNEERIEAHNTEIAECIELASSLAPKYEAGENILIDNHVISVVATDAVEEGNTHPVTSNAVAKKISELQMKKSETWTFALEDGTIVTKKVLVE